MGFVTTEGGLDRFCRYTLYQEVYVDFLHYTYHICQQGSIEITSVIIDPYKLILIFIDSINSYAEIETQDLFIETPSLP